MKTVEDWKNDLRGHSDVEKILAVNTTEDVEHNRKRFVAVYKVKELNYACPSFATLEIVEIDFCVVKYEFQGFDTRDAANSYLFERTHASFDK